MGVDPHGQGLGGADAPPGYQRYVAHGTDIGAGVSGDLAIHDLDGVLGAHVATDRAPSRSSAGCCPRIRDDGVSEAAAGRAAGAGGGRPGIPRSSPRGRTCSHTRAIRPPRRQLAWIVEAKEWTNPPPSSREDAVDRDHLLTNVSIYWPAGTLATFIYEAAHAERDWGCRRARPDRGSSVQTRP